MDAPGPVPEQKPAGDPRTGGEGAFAPQGDTALTPRDAERRTGPPTEPRPPTEPQTGPWTEPRTAPQTSPPTTPTSKSGGFGPPGSGGPPPSERAARKWRSWAWRWTRRLVVFAASVVALLVLQILVYRFVDPPFTPTMAADHLMGNPVEQIWVPLQRVSPAIVKAVIVSEDARFCSHNGIDVDALMQVIEEAGNGSPRGASTISMQVVKNLVLWQGRSYVRKAMELPLTLVLEATWPKRRILEVYLNIAEWGPGIYGIEAASRRTFNKRASQVTAAEAAQLAVVLPNPAGRNARNLGPRVARISGIVAARARGSVDVGCLQLGARGERRAW